MCDEPFRVSEPSGEDSPVLVEVPHAGLGLDPEALAWMAVPCRSLGHDADLYVDELFADAPAVGATLLTARVSRFIVDLNRAEDDYDAAGVVGGSGLGRPRGVIWSASSEGIAVLRAPLAVDEYRRRIAAYHRPYHQALTELLERKRARFGLAVLLCGHSMPTPRRSQLAADLVPGTRGRTSAGPAFIDAVERVGRAHGLSVVHDTPYQGAFSTTHYGRPAQGWHAIQLEVARRTYMDELTLRRDPAGFARMRQFGRSIVAELVKEAERVYRRRSSDGA